MQLWSKPLRTDYFLFCVQSLISKGRGGPVPEYLYAARWKIVRKRKTKWARKSEIIYQLVLVSDIKLKSLPGPYFEHRHWIKAVKTFDGFAKHDYQWGNVCINLRFDVLGKDRHLGFKFKYTSNISSKFFFCVVKLATISLACAMMVPKREAAAINNTRQKICGKQ